jgi:hypothetical protein
VAQATQTVQKKGGWVQRKEWKEDDGTDTDLLLDIASTKVSSGSIHRQAINSELVWLKDPKKLADRVASLLAAGKPDMAAALVREAQGRRIECTVAWNHLMQYCMNRDAPRAAFKFYNDVCDGSDIFSSQLELPR